MSTSVVSLGFTIGVTGAGATTVDTITPFAEVGATILFPCSITLVGGATDRCEVRRATSARAFVVREEIEGAVTGAAGEGVTGTAGGTSSTTGACAAAATAV